MNRNLHIVALVLAVVLPSIAEDLPSRLGDTMLSPIQLRLKTVDKRYCLFTKDSIKLRFRLVLRFNNLGTEPLLIHRVRIPGVVFVARNEESLRKQEYQPGSVMLDSMPPNKPRSYELNKILKPRERATLVISEVWIPVASSAEGDGIGAAPGRHVMEILAVAESSIPSSNTEHLELKLRSEPASFTVSAHPLVQGCE
jgi:hypothetical protein